MSKQAGTPKAWTSEQADVLSSFGEGLAVTAGAGAGKTTTLVEKCVRLLQNKPEARICAVSFTERSASDLRSKLALALRGTPGFELSRHWITTIHGLCGTILREYPEESGFQGDERVLSEVETHRIWQQAIQTLWSESIDSKAPHTTGLQKILSREGKKGTESLLVRFRELEGTGIIKGALESEQEDLRALAEVADRVLERYRRLKAKKSGMDFSDLERGALQALSYESVRKALRSRFELVLVDEFQDTNPIQAKVIWSLIRSDQSNLCVVGDPKQSIYRFRDADVRLFEESCSKLPSRKSLTMNFRSHPLILKSVNQICAPLFESSGLAYEPLSPGRDGADFGLDPDEHPVARLNVESPDGLAEWIRSEWQRGVPLESMAILMRRVRGMETWIQALSRRGIPIAVGGGGLFWQDPRVLELLSLLTWWAFPVDEWAALGFLTAPWVSVPTTQLDQWKRENANFEAFWVSDHPVARCLSPWRHRVTRPGELLSALLEDEQLQPHLSELSQSLLSLWYRCEQLSLQGSGFHEVITRLNESIENGKREKEVPPPSNRGVLPILTVHASKGLEFDRVYLVDFGKKSRAGKLPLLFSDRNRGLFLTPRTPEGKKDEKNESFKDWKSFEQSAAVAEAKRQLYVALTRARKQLIFVCSPIDPEKGFELDREKALLVDHWRGWLEHLLTGAPVLVPGMVSTLEASPPFIDTVESRPKIGPAGWIRTRHSVSEWTILGRCERSYTQLLLEMAGSGGEESSDQPVEHRLEESDQERSLGQSSGSKAAAEFGKAVHALLEDWLIRDGGVVTSEFRSQLESLEQQVGGSKVNIQEILSWVGGPGRPLGQSWAELPFEWRVEGASLVGVIDRVDEVSPGVWKIMDYKVMARRKSHDELLALYAPQLKIYAAAFGRLLRGEFRELSAVLVQITPEGVFETEVPLVPVELSFEISKIAQRAQNIVSQVREQISPQGVSATLGPFCRNCSYRNRCDTAAGQ